MIVGPPLLLVYLFHYSKYDFLRTIFGCMCANYAMFDVSIQGHQMYHMYIVLMYQADQLGEQFHDKLDQKECL